jgi:hypothetical protein
MGLYTDFITQTVKSVEYRGANILQYDDGGGELYISFQTLLKFLEDYVNLKSDGKSIVKIDWESDKPFFAYTTSVSFNLLTCYLYNDYVKNSPGSFFQDGVATFHPFTQFSLVTSTAIIELQKTLETEAGTTENETPPTYSIYPTIGNLNYVYVNAGFISEKLLEGSNNSENQVSVRKMLQDICDGIGKALGSINDFQVIIDEDAGMMTVVDFNQKRIKGLSDIEGTKITTIKAQGLGSFVTDISAQSSITPELATVISIGAQANANQLGVEATSFSRLSTGITDRIYREKIVANNTDISKVTDEGNTQFENTKKAYITVLANQRPKEPERDITFKSDDKLNLENICTELYRALLGKFTETNQVAATFIPVKLDLTLQGISGIKIFQRFTISGDVLPYTYNDNFDFIITGVSHEVSTNNKWLTKISAIIALKET